MYFTFILNKLFVIKPNNLKNDICSYNIIYAWHVLMVIYGFIIGFLQAHNHIPLHKGFGILGHVNYISWVLTL